MAGLTFSHRPLIMGIINVTPDSFSGDGLLDHSDYVKAALAQASSMLEDGADILDIGGESSRPGATPISVEEEIHRVVPVIEAIRTAHGQAPVIAVDTVKASVAEAALEAGANIINDISALQRDPAMATLVAKKNCSIILMHNRSQPQQVEIDMRVGGQYSAAPYNDILEDIKLDLLHAIKIAHNAGIPDEHIILDPGIGFGKNVQQNLALIKFIGRVKELGFPVLMGSSRKSFIGKVLNLPVDERLEGTAATVALSAFLGADIIRVHDVKFMTRVAKMAAAVRDQ